MRQSLKTSIFTSLILLGVIVAFAFLYNASVTTAVADAAYNDKEFLQEYNNEIIERLVRAESVDSWSEIVEQYEDIVVSIEDGENKVIAKTRNRDDTSALDVRVQTPFEYKGEAFLIKSSVYLLRDYVTDVRVLVKFIFIEFLIGISSLALLIFTIYTVMLSPYKKLYESIEQYDKTGNLQNTNIRGYAGKVYSRFVSMTKNLEANQDNERRIIASISHDIKTPLTSIMGYAEQLQKDNISEERKKRYLSTVYGKSLEIKELVNDFDEYLSFNKPQQLEKKICTAEKIASLIKDEYEKELEDIGVTLAVNNYAGNVKLKADLQKLKRVFGNIIGNSIKHFDCEEKIIRADISADRENIYINIHDNGEGIEDELLEIIFEPLYTSDQGRKVAGLGLSICREIIETHGGIIYADRSDLGGLQLCIELPLKNQ